MVSCHPPLNPLKKEQNRKPKKPKKKDAHLMHPHACTIPSVSNRIHPQPMAHRNQDAAAGLMYAIGPPTHRHQPVPSQSFPSCPNVSAVAVKSDSDSKPLRTPSVDRPVDRCVWGLAGCSTLNVMHAGGSSGSRGRGRCKSSPFPFPLPPPALPLAFPHFLTGLEEGHHEGRLGEPIREAGFDAGSCGRIATMQARNCKRRGCDASCHVNQTTVPSRGWIFFGPCLMMDGWVGPGEQERKFVFFLALSLDVEKGPEGDMIYDQSQRKLMGVGEVEKAYAMTISCVLVWCVGR